MDLRSRLALLKPRGGASENAPDPAAASGGDAKPADAAAPAAQPGTSDQPPADATPAPLAERLRRQAIGDRVVPPGASDGELAAALGGTLLAPGLIECDHRVPLPAPHGRNLITRAARVAAPWVAASHELDTDELLFLDTETTGLAGGTGTLPFLLGLARFEGEVLTVRQLFLTGFQGEPALLERMGEWLAPGCRLVSFNGRSFDVPLLATRLRLARMHDRLSALDHIDLLHPTRTAFASRWPDCRLQTAEANLLGFTRTDDFPGHLIPYAWFTFVRTRATHEVPRILEHNHWDVRSLAALLSALSAVYADPAPDMADTLGVARTHRRRGAEPEALRVLAAAPASLDQHGRLELATLHRRRGDWTAAVTLWHALDQEGCLAATECLAKYFEHQAREPAHALRYAERLLALCPGDVAHTARLARLARKVG